MENSVIRKIIETEILTTLAQKSGKKIVPLAVSARHVHLSRAHVEQLFGKGYELQVLRPLSQPGQFACKETVALKTAKGVFEKVRVLGPERPDTQVEISVTDAYKLGINPVVKMSGEVAGTPGCTLVSQTASVELAQGVMIAKRHLHISDEQAEKYSLRDGQIVKLKCTGERTTIFDDVVVRSGSGHDLEIHLDTDEANSAMIKTADYGEILE